MDFIKINNGFQIKKNDEVILSHSEKNPLIYVGYGIENIEMYRGNFKIEDYIEERHGLKDINILDIENGYEIDFNGKITGRVLIKDDLITIDFNKIDSNINRFWIRVNADKEENIYGCGEQMSYFNLRGKNFPIWTSEPGVGRNKNTYITWKSDVENKAGGDYYNTNYPQPTFVSSKHYYLHVDSTAYADFNFKNDNFHELEIWEVPKQIRIETAANFIDILGKLTEYFGRQPELPEWIYNGLMIGVQGGTETSFNLLDKTLEKGIKVSSMWCQDWEGKRVTSFGKRLMWNWKWDKEMYPNLPQKLKELKERGIKFLGYINPYLAIEGDLYKDGKEHGYFATKKDGDDYNVDFGEFYCGVVDFTNPEAYNWYKEIIKEHLINFGLDGWMADFGEYLPIDLKLFNNESPMIEHNHWPMLWAKCNYEALEETGKLGEIVYFMRAGAAGIQKYCTLLWAGDQSVDFSLDDGLASVICGALSAGMTGCGLTHSDIGGYTSLFGNCRSKELFLRWAEMAAFTPVMRTHEGNRPDENFQYYNDEDTMIRLARITDIYTMLSVYIKDLVKENSLKGIPVQRPLFLHYEDDKKSYDIKYEYLLGRDMLVAPVYSKDMNKWEVYLPEDNWVHLWTGNEYTGGEVTVNSELGYTPAFYRKGSKYEDLFKEIRNKYGVK